jgi:hypothetical protein
LGKSEITIGKPKGYEPSVLPNFKVGIPEAWQKVDFFLPSSEHLSTPTQTTDP